VKRRAVALAVFAVAFAAGGCTPRPRPDPASVSWPPAPPATGDTADGPNAPVIIAPPAPATGAALSFVHAWARPGLDQPVWFAGLRRLVTPEYARLLAATDPANVPAHTVTGAPVAQSSTTQALITDVPTDAGIVRVTVIPISGRWLVASAIGIGLR
jgi:hypothetical protein